MPETPVPTQPAPGMRLPSTIHIATIGVATGAAVVGWVACIATLAAGCPTRVTAGLLCMTVTASVLAIVLWSSYHVIRTSAHNSGQVLAKACEVDTSLAQMAAEMEQLSAKVDRVDPWAIYTALASDLLGQGDHGRRP